MFKKGFLKRLFSPRPTRMQILCLNMDQLYKNEINLKCSMTALLLLLLHEGVFTEEEYGNVFDEVLKTINEDPNIEPEGKTTEQNAPPEIKGKSNEKSKIIPFKIPQ